MSRSFKCDVRRLYVDADKMLSYSVTCAVLLCHTLTQKNTNTRAQTQESRCEEKDCVFSELAITYLILGGVGAGCISICSLLDLVLVRESFGFDREQGPLVRTDANILDFAFIAGFVVFCLGCACLVVDLGRTDRLLSLLVRPSLTWMTFGVYAISVLLVVGALLALVRVLYIPEVRRGVVIALEFVALVVGLAVASYTGLLVSGLIGVAFWNSPWLVPLFVTSSLSGGIALVVICGAFVVKDEVSRKLLHQLALADILVIIVEGVSATLFVLGALYAENPGAFASAQSILEGSQSPIWWFGFVLCGMAVPLVAEIIFVIAGKRDSDMLSNALGCVAVLVLVGVICMRVSVIGAGEHRPLELQVASVSSAADKASDGEQELMAFMLATE